MKKLLRILVTTAFFATILLAGTLSSCDGETAPTPSPSELPEYVMTLYRESNANGKVLTMQTYDSEGRITSSMGSGTYSDRYEYDDEGRLVRELSGGYSTEYEYDGDERIGREYQTSDSEKLLTWTRHETYDEQGRLIEQKFYNGSGEWVYTMTYIHTSGMDFVCTEQYVDYAADSYPYEDGLYDIEKTVYDEQGRELSGIDYDSMFGEQPWENTYDEQGNLIQIDFYDCKGNLWRSEHYEYADGDDGLLAEMTTLNQYGFPESATVYTYDDYGNCIREETVRLTGDTTWVIEREFVRRSDAE